MFHLCGTKQQIRPGMDHYRIIVTHVFTCSCIHGLNGSLSHLSEVTKSVNSYSVCLFVSVKEIRK